ncbi:unnamed protein product [Lepeophtheirus salmonis]|uniref:(salmon louse) hypothetical protein n=1 Tax=Lepeophtheirus salmonis TaxID=72036 RepID=A0A7R8CHP8_LEPSM|nr:unnamed protein product [Lepeophtheirus salmonis]CAF2825858.1 unnamed protein product [Lepeophtheirus salmonis]
MTPSEIKLFRLISECKDLDTINETVVPCTHQRNKDKKCLQMGCVNASDKNGNTALHLAAQAEYNSEEMTEILLEKGKANPGIKNFDGETPVLLAAKKGNLKTLKRLISKCSEQGFSYGLLNRLSYEPGKDYVGRQCTGNVLEKACESKNEECVNYLIDEIFNARRVNMKPTLNTQISCTSSVESLNIKEFLSVSDIKQNNENSTYAKILFNTPTSFRHLLDGCLFTYRNKIYVDFFPFYNPEGGSELSILKIIIHYKRFELLTHPVCELFLHLNCYGQVAQYIDDKCGETKDNNYEKSLLNTEESPDYAFINTTNIVSDKSGGLPCIARWFCIPLIILSTCISLVEFAKLVADRGGISFFYNKIYWTQPELWSHIIVFVIACLEQLPESMMLHMETRKVLSTISVLIVSKMMVQVIARDPDIAIFVEMVKKIQLGSATAKVLAMFTGEIGFEAAFKSSTTFKENFKFHLWITIMYTIFVFEMCLTLMNVLIGLAISNIQDLRQKGDALRLVKEVLLGGYLESLLRAHPLRRPFRLIDCELFNGRSIYQLDQHITDESVVPCYTLQLLRTISSGEEGEDKNTSESAGISVPTNIGIKLRQLLKDMDVKEKEMEKGDQKLTLETLKNLQSQMKELNASVKQIQKIINEKFHV